MYDSIFQVWFPGVPEPCQVWLPGVPEPCSGECQTEIESDVEPPPPVPFAWPAREDLDLIRDTAKHLTIQRLRARCPMTPLATIYDRYPVAISDLEKGATAGSPFVPPCRAQPHPRLSPGTAANLQSVAM